jgi:ribosomal protein S18 acetylase RimI-like enzyme
MMQLRAATPEDALEVARVHVRGWQIGYRGLLPGDFLDGLSAEDRAARYTFGSSDPHDPSTIVAVTGSSIVGFATIGAADDDTPGAGELLALYVDPDWWGRGIGHALLAEAREQLVQRGFAEAIVWVLRGNERAMRLYRNDGWVADGKERRVTVSSIEVDEVRCLRSLTADRPPSLRS